jgi:hypothetical protein
MGQWLGGSPSSVQRDSHVSIISFEEENNRAEQSTVGGCGEWIGAPTK